MNEYEKDQNQFDDFDSNDNNHESNDSDFAPAPFNDSEPISSPEDIEEDGSESSSGHKIFISLMVIILISFGVYWFFFTPDSNPNLDNKLDAAISDDLFSNEDDLIDTSVSTEVNESLISVSRQLAGNQVIIDTVKLISSSWVSIEEDKDGERGNVLGALWLPAGAHTDQTVELLRDTISGQTYHAVLRADYGDDHRFDHNLDTPLTDQNSIIFSTFSVN